MVAHRVSRFPKRRFNETWIAAVRVRANSLRSAKKKTSAKFCPAFLKEKRSALRSQFSFATKTLDRKITARSRANFDPRTPITPTKRNTEFETGMAAVARLRVKPSVVS